MARKKIRRGEMPLASDWNSLLDDVAAMKAKGRGPRAGDRFFVKNLTGTEISRGNILGINGLSIGPDDNLAAFLDTIILSGGTPDLETHEFKYAVALEPIAEGSIGRCAIDGLVRVRLNVIDENDRYAIVDDAQVVLASHWFGNARIIAKETESGSGTGSVLSTGEMWAVVRLNDPSEMKFVGKTTVSGIAAGSSGAVIVYGEVGSWTPLQREDGDVVLSEVWHPPGSGEVDDVDGDVWVQVERECVRNKWVVDVEYCPAGGS